MPWSVPERPGQSLTEALVDDLRKKRLLLVLDNCEHLIEAAAQLADALLSSCPHLRVVATSREALGVEGELVWRVDPLSVPDARDVIETLIERPPQESCTLRGGAAVRGAGQAAFAPF